MKLDRVLLLLFLVLSLTNSFGQNDSKKLDFEQIELERKQFLDSARNEFNKQPKTLTLHFEKNGKKINLKQYELCLKIDGKINSFPLDDSNRLIVDFPLDTNQKIELIFKSKKINIQANIDNPSLIDNGATIHFGIMNDIRKVVRQDTIKKSFEDWKLNEVESNYRQLLEYEELNQAIKDGRISRITYAIVIPRVFGCGTVTTYQRFE